MPRNGSGSYSLPSGNPVVTNTTISSTTMNSTLSDIATALSGSVSSDGQTAMTGNLPMGGNKITGLANGTATGDAAAYGQLAVLIPSGVILDYGAAAAPTGWLLCDGSAVSRTVYSALFSAIGTTWGSGDGSTTFNVPDLRGRATIGAGTGSGLSARTLGTQNIGEETHVLTTAELAAHNHTATSTDSGHTHTDAGHSHSLGLGGGSGTARLMRPDVGGVVNFGSGLFSTSDITATANGSASISSGTANITTTVNNNGSGTAHNNMQPSAVVTKIIKT